MCIDATVARWTSDRPLVQLTRRFGAWGRKRGRQDVGDLDELAAIEVLGRNEQGRPTRYTVTDVAGQQVELSAEHLLAAANVSGA